MNDTTKEELIQRLNALIQTCIDAKEGFEQAAKYTRDFELRALFTDHARLRAAMAADLQEIVRGLNAEPATTGTSPGVLRRTWSEQRKSFVGRSDAAILAGCRRCEESTVEEFRATLAGSLPPEPDALLRRQFAVIVATCERLRSLEESLAKQGSA